jgi:hypothetical protein
VLFISAPLQLIIELDKSTQIIIQLLKGLFNIFFIFRNYYFQQPIDWLFIILGLIQFAVLGLAFYKVIYKKSKLTITPQDRFSLLLLGIGFFYLLVLNIMKIFTTIDPFNYRLLAPFTFPLFTAIIIYFSRSERNINFKKLEVYLFCLFIASLIWNLPKKFLIDLWWVK